MTKTLWISFAAASMLMLACKAAKPVVTPNTAVVATNNSNHDIKPEWLDIAKDMDGSATMEHLATGKTIYYETCTKCHGWKDARKYDPVAWERVLQAMIPRAKLTPDEAHHLRLYTLVFQKS
jgi:cytochrome c5